MSTIECFRQRTGANECGSCPGVDKALEAIRQGDPTRPMIEHIKRAATENCPPGLNAVLGWRAGEIISTNGKSGSGEGISGRQEVAVQGNPA